MEESRAHRPKLKLELEKLTTKPKVKKTQVSKEAVRQIYRKAHQKQKDQKQAEQWATEIKVEGAEEFQQKGDMFADVKQTKATTITSEQITVNIPIPHDEKTGKFANILVLI